MLFDNFSPDQFIYYSSLASDCPMCHKGIIPECVYLTSANDSKFDLHDGYLHIVGLFVCPSCKSMFMVRFSRPDLPFDNVSDCIDYYAPERPHADVEFDNIIKEISPLFIEIYEQSESAKNLGLDQIAGSGYRRAFEVLIKDYACSISPKEESDTIKSDWLSKVIKERIDNPTLKEVIEKVNYLGTDHGHYYKKYAEYDIDDLRKFINTTVSWIKFLDDTERIKAIPKRKI